jgi:hypothetical protein
MDWTHGLIFFGVPILFAVLDYFFHRLRNREVVKKEMKDSNGNSLTKPYDPNVKIWGLGGLLGLVYVLLSRLDTTWFSSCGNDVKTVSAVVLILGLVGFLVFAIVMMVKED